jgi:AraC-like DNA-binding protein
MIPWHERRSYDEGFPIYANRVRDLEFLAHWHTDIELLFVASGSILVSVNGSKRRLAAGSFAACGSRDIHYYERVNGPSETILVIFKAELIGRNPQWPAGGRLGGNFATEDEHPRLASAASRIMAEVLAEMDAKQASYEGVVRGQLLELLSLAERELAQAAAGAKVTGSEGLPSLERMQLAIDYLYENSHNPVCLEDAAKAASLSPSYFSRVFARTTGTSFRSFLNGIRLERAEELMRDTEAKFADIAFECGFESVRTFNRSFRALRGTTPGTSRGAAR